MDDIKKKLDILEKKIDELHKKLDALIYADDDAQEFMEEKIDIEDELFIDAVYVVCQHERASASLLQRRLQIGFNRASRLMEIMEKEGVVSAQIGANAREVLIEDPKAFLEKYLNEKFRN